MRNVWGDGLDDGMSLGSYLNRRIITRIKVIYIGETVFRTRADYICIGVDCYIVYFAVMSLDTLDELELYVFGEEIYPICIKISTNIPNK